MSDNINASCPCTYPCTRHGDCKACQEYHTKCGSKTSCGADCTCDRKDKKN